MAGDAATGAGADAGRGSAGEVFRVALLLGLTSFGGPIAHLGYFHREYVQRRRWLSEATYGDLVALSQFLPGPASSQIGIGVGLLRAGWLGAVAAWVGFTLPSAVALTAFALATTDVDLSGAGWVHGLKLAAVAIVALAVLSMWRALAPDAPRKVIAIAAATAMLLLQSAALQVVVIAVGGLVGWRVLSGLATPPEADIRSPVGQTTGLVLLAVFLALLVGLPLAVALSHIEWVAVVDSFYRAGALVFGGGHVVLPLLDEAVVTPGWVSEDTFLAGYGAAQAVPGPLFTFAAFLGASLRPEPNGVGGALLALVAIFLPSFLLIGGALPFWERMRRSVAFRRGLAGTNAAVVGLLVAALYDPVWSSSVRSPVDVALVVLAVAALAARNAPPWLVVAALASAGQVVQWVSA
jgi:chromate transporter